MVDLLLRLAGSAVIGWLLGAAAGSTMSRVFYGGGADQLAMLFAPVRWSSSFWPRTRSYRTGLESGAGAGQGRGDYSAASFE